MSRMRQPISEIEFERPLVCAEAASRITQSCEYQQLQAGVPVTVVSKILGQASIPTTLNIYAHVLAEDMEQFECQRARILGTYRAPEVSAVAEEQQVA